MNIKNKTCCFFGHRKISESEELIKRLYQAVENLIIEKMLILLFLAVKANSMIYVIKL